MEVAAPEEKASEIPNVQGEAEPSLHSRTSTASNKSAFLSVSQQITKVPIDEGEVEHQTVNDDPTSIPKTALPKSAARKTYASFGDEGTTASANAYGHLMQISSFLGLELGRSGFFCVDVRYTPEPWTVWSRMRSLEELVEDPDTGIRLVPMGPSASFWEVGEEARPMEFVHDRWPRFTFDCPPPAEHNYVSEATHSESPAGSTVEEPIRSAARLKLTVQFYSHGGTIFQQYTWQRADPEGPLPSLPSFVFDSKLLIRDLDFVDGRNHFNDKGPNDSGSGYVVMPVVHQQSLVITHERPTPKQRSEPSDDNSTNNTLLKSPTAIALIVMAFSDLTAQKIEPVRMGSSDYKVILGDDAKATYKESGRLEITMAYKLQDMPVRSWGSSVAPMKDVEAMKEAFSSEPAVVFKRLRFSSHDQLDFAVRRNLEHILSVCSIPVVRSPGSTVPIWDGSGAITPIAFTCGDIAGHRVTLQSSFFQFQFLLSVLEYLEKNEDQAIQRDTTRSSDHVTEDSAFFDRRKCVSRMKERIRSACEGHLLWMFEIADGPNKAFAPHYWATGIQITDREYLPPPSCSDTPLQLIKVENYKILCEHRYGHTWTTEPRVLDRLSEKIKPWLRTLDEVDKRGKYAYPRPQKESDYGVKIPKYRLADHVLIYQALRAITNLELNDSMQASRLVLNPTPEEQEDFVNLVYSPEEVQKNILKRFSIENPVTEQRMLATSRTWKESRFLFRSKDTALFYAMDRDQSVFDYDTQRKSKDDEEPSLVRQLAWRHLDDRWKNTVEAQSQHEHEDSQFPTWQKPLWYALAIIMGSKRKRVNRMAVDEMLEYSTMVLLEASSPNGLFPGLLDDHQDPVRYDSEYDRDDYWNTTFEIPYALWVYGKDFLEGKQHRGSSGEIQQENQDSVEKTSRSAARRIAQPTSGVVPDPKGSSKPGRLMKKHVPFINFNNLIDRGVLVEIHDDWLQEGPPALDFTFEPNFVKIDEVESEGSKHEKASIKGIKKNYGPSKSEKTLKTAMSKYDWTSGLFSDMKNRKGLVIDIPRGSKGEELRKTRHQTNEGLLRTLGLARTVQRSKKRIVWLPNGDPETALICYLASPVEERGSMSKFFERHASHEKYFFDSTTATLNEWETEIHLSFFMIEKPDTGKPDAKSTSNLSDYSFVILKDKTAQPGKGSETTVIRSTMSFRFIGDFFDRFWTCHFLEHRPSAISSNFANRLSKLKHTQPSKAQREGPQDSRAKNPWQQRKVLELLLLNEMLVTIESSTKDILGWVRSIVLQTTENEASSGGPVSLLPQQHSMTVTASRPLNDIAVSLRSGSKLLEQGGNESYFAIIGRWRLFEQFLQTIEDDLSENLESLNDWSRREENRGFQRPRWMRNDERRYRATITEVLVLNERKIRDLERLRAGIQAFRESLTGRLASIRDDRAFRGSENINLFTYVTVVFLPLGFATGIYSMSEAPTPTRGTLINMVVTSVVALSVTIFALINAKLLDSKVVEPTIGLLRWIGNMLIFFILILGWPIAFFLLHFVVYPLRRILGDGWFMRTLESWQEAVKYSPPIKCLKMSEMQTKDSSAKKEEEKGEEQGKRKGKKKGKKQDTEPETNKGGSGDQSRSADNSSCRSSRQSYYRSADEIV